MRWRLVSTTAIARTWASAEPQPFVDLPRASGRPFLRIERDAGLGYKVAVGEDRIHVVSDYEATLATGVWPQPSRRWQRLFPAQVLPLAAALSGLELLHASAVGLDGGVFAFVAPSGTGKTLFAPHVVTGSGDVVSDDVLAVDVDGRSVRAHPGAAGARVVAAELRLLQPAERLGLVAGTSAADGKIQMDVVSSGPLRTLCGLFFLRRSGGEPELAVRSAARPAAPRILAAAFLPWLHSPERMARSHAVAAAIAVTVRTYSVSVPSWLNARALRVLGAPRVLGR